MPASTFGRFTGCRLFHSTEILPARELRLTCVYASGPPAGLLKAARIVEKLLSNGDLGARLKGRYRSITTPTHIDREYRYEVRRMEARMP